MESKSKDNNGQGGIEAFMIWSGIVGLISALIWTFTSFEGEEQDVWTWFSRYSIGVICLGFAGVIREIKKLRENA